MALHIEDGISFELQKVDDLTEDVIREIRGNDENVWDLPPAFEAMRGKSFIGGLPLWIQGNETPKDVKGRRSSFLMQIDGFDPLMEASPLAFGVVYLFLDAAGNPYWVAQN